MSVQRHTNGIDECDIDPGKPFINWMITELSGTDGKKSTDSSQSTRSLGKSIVDE
jgi:hypothetical protein